MLLQNQPFADWIKPPIQDAWFLTGPTASGKSRVALELAEKIDAEIISVDSMAVYRGMDIGTAKPTPDQRKQVPHHLIDLVDPTNEYSVSQFVVDAHAKADEVRARGKKVLLVGGTPLYIKTLFCGMFLGPPADWEFRAAVEADVAEFGMESLRKRLELVDPLSAHKILDGDIRRMTRALEVAKITGRPLSHWQNQFERVQGPSSCKCFALAWDRPMLHERVSQRVDGMFRRGLLDEVKSLIVRFGALGRTAAQAVGYKEPMEFLNGTVKENDMIEKVKAHTRQLVRRQEIWFRSMPSIKRVPITSESDLERATSMILV
ncbi:MAG TPA: tRNA (adenosine(37)-N6)-dimethylallyltransferase MiaA [Pirellula sp.]|nr:tRNA (adenosine(37)-N6)-dimethylallyltransferase MiaA [Pirellula sp.]